MLCGGELRQATQDPQRAGQFPAFSSIDLSRPPPGDFDLVMNRIVELAKDGIHDTEELSHQYAVTLTIPETLLAIADEVIR
jgi:hypothetical protein